MLDRGKHFNTEKQSSSVPKRDLTRSYSQEKSESQHRDEKRNSATSSSQEVMRSKASSSNPARALAKQRISKRSDHQPLSGQWPTGRKFPREISRATSSSFSGRDARPQRKYDPLLRTQGRQLRGGADPEDSSEQQGESDKQREFDETMNKWRQDKEEIQRDNDRRSTVPWKPEFIAEDFDYKTPDPSEQKEHEEFIQFKPEDFEYKIPEKKQISES